MKCKGKPPTILKGKKIKNTVEETDKERHGQEVWIRVQYDLLEFVIFIVGTAE